MNRPAALDLVEPLDRQTLGGRTYAQLSDLLISGRMAPGEKISLRQTAEVRCARPSRGWWPTERSK